MRKLKSPGNAATVPTPPESTSVVETSKKLVKAIETADREERISAARTAVFENANSAKERPMKAPMSQVIERQFIRDEDIEVYFKAADVAVLPYTYIFQSGVLFLAYGFGVPVIATDVGSLREDVVDGRTGFVCAPRDATALAAAIEQYFSSDFYRNLEERRHQIRHVVSEEHAWSRAQKS